MHVAARAAYGDAAPDTQLARGRVELDGGNRPAAAVAFRGAYEGWRVLLGSADNNTLEAALASALPAADLEVLSLRRCVYAGRKNTLGASHARTLEAAEQLATTLSASSGANSNEARKEALGLLLDTLEMRRIVLGAAHPDTLFTQFEYATSMFTFDASKAAGLLKGALDGFRRVMGDDHFYTLNV